eukprot:1645042-Rhodomonas_salina.1
MCGTDAGYVCTRRGGYCRAMCGTKFGAQTGYAATHCAVLTSGMLYASGTKASGTKAGYACTRRGGCARNMCGVVAALEPCAVLKSMCGTNIGYAATHCA